MSCCRVRLLPVIDHHFPDTDIRSANFLHLRSAIDELSDRESLHLFSQKVIRVKLIHMRISAGSLGSGGGPSFCPAADQ